LGRDDAPAAKRPEEPVHWSFRPIAAPEPPAPKDAAWIKTPVDAFILARLQEQALAPAPTAGCLTLLRRVYFDLLGLPPPPEEVARFAADLRPDAYEKLVERLLESPHYGERWGRHWLDVVRYADTGGFEVDHLYPSAWRYRDYVIRSFNANKPFDRFLEEQVAGDELWPDDPDAITASALYCTGPALGESAMVSNQLEYEWLTDAADTTGAAFLGLTFGCARCHNHKYDPISQNDYFAMQAVFAASDRPYPAKIRDTRIKALNGLLSETPLPEDLKDDPRCTVKTESETGFRLFHRPAPLAVRKLRRGELSKPQEVVGPGFPTALLAADHTPDFSEIAPGKRRAALARWLTSATNPLVARVLVNRIWGWHFGQGIVRTPNDFGNQGEPPTHPELLAWLARDFLNQGWDLKRLHRQIVLSSTYRMQSNAPGAGMSVDAENRLLWHFPRHRLEGEAIRDAMLACAGDLNIKAFGPSVVPPLSGDELTGLFDAKTKWPVSKDTAEHTRRSVYLLVRRTFVYPMFAAFDPPEMMTSCPRRIQTVVPTQALAMLNSPLAREQSAGFARRLLEESKGETGAALARGWVLAFGRPISAAESARALAFLHSRESASGHGSAHSRRERALAELCLALFNANEFLYVD
jgi:hypothetical protein